jgi:hypothetical protein
MAQCGISKAEIEEVAAREQEDNISYKIMDTQAVAQLVVLPIEPSQVRLSQFSTQPETQHQILDTQAISKMIQDSLGSVVKL